MGGIAAEVGRFYSCLRATTGCHPLPVSAILEAMWARPPVDFRISTPRQSILDDLITRITIECVGVGRALGFTARRERCRQSQPLQGVIVAVGFPAAALILPHAQQSGLRPLDVPAQRFSCGGWNFYHIN